MHANPEKAKINEGATSAGEMTLSAEMTMPAQRWPITTGLGQKDHLGDHWLDRHAKALPSPEGVSVAIGEEHRESTRKQEV